MKNLITVFCLFAVVLGKAQSIPGFQLPATIPVSPSASDIAKYINYPIDYSNGLPNISIPLYEVKDGDIGIPISLSFHSSGFKPYLPGGWLGQGWTLHAEPAISRSVQGMPDEQAYILNNTHSPAVVNGSFYKFQLADGVLDIQPDEYYYKLPDQSGKFFVKKEYNQPLQAVSIPKEQVKIKFPSETDLNQFVILDNKGLSYTFGGTQREMTDLSKVTSWKGTSVTSALTGKTVSFTYYNWQGVDVTPFPADQVTIMDMVQGAGYPVFDVNPLNAQEAPPVFQLPMPAILKKNHNSITYYKVGTSVSDFGQVSQLTFSSSSVEPVDTKVFQININEINFSGGKVVFTKVGSGQLSLLNSIKVYNANNAIIKEFELHQSHSSYGGGARLDSISIKDASGAVAERYKFEYYGTPVQVWPRSVDYWGYYNGAANPTSLVHTIQTTGKYEVSSTYYDVGFTINGADRSPNEEAMKLNMLKKIVYPTGGQASFFYEANRYKNSSGQLQIAGGLRIQAITQSDNSRSGQVISRFFKYGENEDGSGILKIPINDEIFYSTQDNVYHHPVVIGADPFSPTGYKWMSTASIIGVRTRTFSSSPLIDLFYGSGAPVQYPVVTEYSAENASGLNALGKQVFYYNVVPGSSSTKVPGEAVVFDAQIDWLFGKETLRKTYKSEGGTFSPTPIQQQKTDYSDINLANYAVGMPKFYTRTRLIGDYQYRSTYESHVIYTYTVNSGYKRPSKITETTTENGLNLVKEHEYVFDDYLNVASEKTTSSNGDQVSNEYQYPYSPGSGMNLYATNNNITPIIITKKLINNVLREQTKTSYLEGTVEKLFPVARYYSQGADPLEKRLDFLQYDPAGNLLSVRKTNDFTTNYIYSYKGLYPVAKIENVPYATVESVLGGAVAVENFKNSVYPNDASINTFLAPLRTHASLKNALITTYTYAPLVGMTSQADPNNRITYYEYDGFGRLYMIRDQDHNIVKRFRYNYAGQPIVQ